jgi:ATP-binding cassette subfamily F protein uup
MARESNLLVLDEPTNDLDIETLDLLQELLDDFDGTVLLVSHDRDFLDRVATTTIAMEGDGRATTYAGGWSDYRAQRGADAILEASKKADKTEAKTPELTQSKQASTRLSFTEKHRLEELPAQMERIAAEIAKLEELLSDATLFTREPVKFKKATEALTTRQTALAEAEAEWLDLAERAED